MSVPIVGNPLHAADFKKLMGAWTVQQTKTLALDKALRDAMKRDPEAGETLLFEVHLQPGQVTIYQQAVVLLQNPAKYHKMRDGEFVIQVEGELSRFHEIFRTFRFLVKPGGVLMYLHHSPKPSLFLIQGSAIRGELDDEDVM